MISESVPFSKDELFGINIENGTEYNFKFNDGENYKVLGENVENFKRYVFEEDGMVEGREYIIEKVKQ